LRVDPVVRRVRVPAIAGDEEISLRLLLERGIAVHGRAILRVPRSGWLVVSLLTRAGVFRAGIDGMSVYSVV